jgi:hypothetical protein
MSFGLGAGRLERPRAQVVDKLGHGLKFLERELRGTWRPPAPCGTMAVEHTIDGTQFAYHLKRCNRGFVEARAALLMPAGHI